MLLLATALNAIDTALAPLLVPLLFITLTGVELNVQVFELMVELLVIIPVSTIVGVGNRTAFASAVAPTEPLLSATGSIVCRLLLLAVFGPERGDYPLHALGRGVAQATDRL